MFNNLISGSERDRVSHIWVRKRQGEFVTHRGGPLRLVGCPPVWVIGGSVGKSSAEYSRSEIGSFVSAVIHRGVESSAEDGLKESRGLLARAS